MTPTISDIPPGLTGDQLTQAVNDRLRRILKLLIPPGPTSQDLNMGGFRVVHAGDAHNPTDLVNLQTGDKRWLQQPTGAATSQNTKTIIMQSSGNIALGSLVTPAFTNTLDPAYQYIAEKAYISAVQPPTGSSAIIDPVMLPAGSTGAYQSVLKSPLVLLAGQTGPVLADNFVQVPFMTTELDMWNANVLQIGSTFPGAQVFIGIRVRQVN